MLNHLVKSIAATAFRPRLPMRTFWEQVMCSTLERVINSAQGKGLNDLRAKIDGASPGSKNLRKISINKMSLDGVDCLQFTPKELSGDDDRLIVYLHGGGYVFGSPSSYKALIADIALSADCQVIAPDYGLAPEHPFPKPQNDCLQATKAVMSQFSDKKIIIAGDSAGGALALATVSGLTQQGMQADGLVLISPWVDPMADGGSMVSNDAYDYLTAKFLNKSFQALMQGADVTDPRVNFSSYDFTRLPKTLVQYGTAELFSDQIEEFVGRGKQANELFKSQAYRDQCHDFQFFTGVSKTSRLAVARIGEFIRAV